jgi:segregation and condensation protein A
VSDGEPVGQVGVTAMITAEVAPSVAAYLTDEELAGRLFTGHPVALPIFEGPVDLLLFLIKRERIDIFEIPIAQITRQYLEYVMLLEALDVEVAAEFVVTAAALMEFKSRSLLPKDQQAEEENEEEELDPRAALTARLLEYQQYKDVSDTLRERGEIQRYVFAREFGVPEDDERWVLSGNLTAEHLWAALQEVLARVETRGGPRTIVKPRFTVRQKMAAVMKTVLELGSVSFLSLFDDVLSKIEVIVTLLAVLELVRLGKIRVRQERAFGEIVVIRHDAS